MRYYAISLQNLEAVFDDFLKVKIDLNKGLLELEVSEVSRLTNKQLVIAAMEDINQDIISFSDIVNKVREKHPHKKPNNIGGALSQLIRDPEYGVERVSEGRYRLLKI